MLANRFTVVLDANVIGPALPRNLALSLADAGFFRPRWSEEVLNEVQRYIAKKIGDTDKAEQHRIRIARTFPEGLVDINKSAEQRLTLPDDNDRHVLAAAIKVRAQLIVTDNLRDFPSAILQEFELEAVSADHFLADTMTLDLTKAIACVARMRMRLQNPQLTPEELVLRCERSGLLETASILADHASLL